MIIIMLFLLKKFWWFKNYPYLYSVVINHLNKSKMNKFKNTMLTIASQAQIEKMIKNETIINLDVEEVVEFKEENRITILGNEYFILANDGGYSLKRIVMVI